MLSRSDTRTLALCTLLLGVLDRMLLYPSFVSKDSPLQIGAIFGGVLTILFFYGFYRSANQISVSRKLAKFAFIAGVALVLSVMVESTKIAPMIFNEITHYGGISQHFTRRWLPSLVSMADTSALALLSISLYLPRADEETGAAPAKRIPVYLGALSYVVIAFAAVVVLDFLFKPRLAQIFQVAKMLCILALALAVRGAVRIQTQAAPFESPEQAG